MAQGVTGASPDNGGISMKRRMYMSARATFWLLVVVMTMGASLAYAIDTKIYPGSMCVKWSSGGIATYNWSSIRTASSTSTLGLDCPAVHDAVNIQSGWVRVTDLNFSADIRCTLESVYRANLNSSVFHWFSGPRSSVGSSPNVQTLTFGPVGANSISHYYYSCSIPPTYSGNVSSIHTYQIVENE
jgi:hypothetical protein